jgi:hypothetical protein
MPPFFPGPTRGRSLQTTGRIRGNPLIAMHQLPHAPLRDRLAPALLASPTTHPCREGLTGLCSNLLMRQPAGVWPSMRTSSPLFASTPALFYRHPERSEGSPDEVLLPSGGVPCANPFMEHRRLTTPLVGRSESQAHPPRHHTYTQGVRPPDAAPHLKNSRPAPPHRERWAYGGRPYTGGLVMPRFMKMPARHSLRTSPQNIAINVRTYAIDNHIAVHNNTDDKRTTTTPSGPHP